MNQTKKRIIIGITLSLALTAVFVGFGLVSSTSVKELTGSLVTIGSTLGGFFLTALAVLLGMSGKEFFDRIIQMKKAYNGLVSTFGVTVSSNFALVLAAVVNQIITQKWNEYVIATSSATLLVAIFIFSAYFDILTLKGFFKLLRIIPNAKKTKF